MLISENKIFAITDDHDILYIKKGHSFSHSLIKKKGDAASVKIGSVVYYPYKFTGKKPRNYDWDCLKFTESVSENNGTIDLGDSPARFREPYTGLLIGHTEKQNIKIAKTYPKDLEAKPGVSDAYVIIRNKVHKFGEYPYHAAPVIALDGESRITVETFADTGNPPGFMMYDDGHESFQDRWKEHFMEGKKVNAVTVIGIPRN